MISLTYDIPTNHETKMMPVLDVQVVLDNRGLISYEFYEKPTKNPLTILANSAISWSVKRTVFTQEALRIMRNTSLTLGPETANKHLSKFMLKLKDSGYNETFRSEIIKSAKNAFSLMIENHTKGIRPLPRNRHQIIKDRQTRRGGVDWWNRGLQKDMYQCVLFVPPTPGAKLAKLIQAKEAILNADSNRRIKVVEGPGIKLKNLIESKNPYPTQPCSIRLCPLCKQTEVSEPSQDRQNRLHCSTPNVGYQITCQTCRAAGKDVRYEGETGRPAVSRAVEHIKGLLNNDKNNPLEKHRRNNHRQEKKKVRFEFNILQRFRDPLTRQAEEGLRIAHNPEDVKLLNSKKEFYHPPIARIKIDK